MLYQDIFFLLPFCSNFSIVMTTQSAHNRQSNTAYPHLLREKFLQKRHQDVSMLRQQRLEILVSDYLWRGTIL